GPYRYISATNIGPMGWAVAAGIGVKAARPDDPVVVITGDGCMRMTGMEIATAARYGLPVIYVVINNAALGNVYLRMRSEGPVPVELTELPMHDWVGLARALGADGVTVEDPALLGAALVRAFEAKSTFVVDVHCDRDAATPVAPWSQARASWHDD
ncbi:MAG TPA: thiamine pyrophosphate-dependent enzyme, partial [Verrucomicrobiae bacterium]|nr:thiamine pyrophosphate-dependent enzyme [Verrucomicrobiae bacterium]